MFCQPSEEEASNPKERQGLLRAPSGLVDRRRPIGQPEQPAPIIEHSNRLHKIAEWRRHAKVLKIRDANVSLVPI